MHRETIDPSRQGHEAAPGVTGQGIGKSPFMAIPQFHDALNQQFASSNTLDRHPTVLAVKLSRFDGLIASLIQEEQAELLDAVARRIRLAVGIDAPVANMRHGVVMTSVVLDDVARQTSCDCGLPGTLLQLFQEPFLIGEQLVFLPINIGVAYHPDHGLDAESLVNAAWLATRANRRSGESTCQVYDSEIAQRLRRKRVVEHALRQAVIRIERAGALDTELGATQAHPFELVYQPKVDLGTLQVGGVEALVRWNDAAIGAGPGEFIAIAEETGLIVPLGRWIVRQALYHQRNWEQSGIRLKLAINVSPAQLSSTERPRFPEFLAAEIAAIGVDPALIEIEITEGIMADPDARSAITELSNSGVRIAVDDFGKLYSNLAILSSIPASTLKIDKEFVDDIVDDDRKRIVAEQVVTLARSLGMRSIMEGVETSEQLEILSTLGCDEVQGYVFSRPMTADLVPLAQTHISTLIRGFGGRSSFRKPTSYPALVDAVNGCAVDPERKRRIVLIDDQADLCDAVAIGLERQGYEVGQFYDPLQALTAVAKDPRAWDLVITDENMPNMRGLQLLKAVKQLRRDLPVILWTGFAGEAPEETARAHGADLYLEKPIASDRLAAEVKTLLSPAA